jgi:hypothetical protein
MAPVSGVSVATIKPLQMAGIVNSLDGAARVFLALDVIASVAYMLLVRQWSLAGSVAHLPGQQRC